MFLLLLVLALGESTPKPVDWQKMLPVLRPILLAEFQDMRQAIYPISIDHTADLTGTGTSEALVDLGVGGASTDEMTVVRMEGNHPVVALFKDKRGKISTMTFLDGSSVMHGDGVELLPKEHAVYSSQWSMDGEGMLANCSGEAYRWTAQSKTFDFNLRLSHRLTQDFCRNISASLLRH